MGHAKLSPSSASRWLNCPGSIRACEGIPNLSSEFADEGTFAHEVAEQALRACLGRGEPALDALHALEGTVSKCGRFTADSVMIDHLEEYVEFCASLMPGADVSVEARVKAIPGKVYGTADYVAVVDNVLHVDDFKYGAGVPVSPVNNSQARCYAIGALNRIRSTDTKAYEKIDTVDIRIFQPRNRAGGGVETLSKHALESWLQSTLEPGVAATEDPDAPLCAGDWCRFCPAKDTCPAIKSAALDGAKAIFADPVSLEVVDTPPSADDLTPEEMAKVLTAAPMIDTWVKSVRARAYELANSGKPIPGFKLVRTSGKRSWADEDKAVALLREMLPEGVNTHEDPKLLSPAKAEKQLDVLGKALVAELTVKSEGGTTLAPESDRRKAYLPTEVFTILN